MSPVESLIGRLKERVQDPDRAADLGRLRAIYPKAYPPVPAQFLQRAEKQLGFPLPSLLKRLYQEVGDGAFGPALGLTGVGPSWGEGTSSLVEEYRGHRSGGGGRLEDWVFQWELAYDPDAAAERAPWRWPERLLPVAGSAGVTHCLDCNRDEAPVTDFWYTGWRHGEPWSSLFRPVASSLANWLEDWLDGRLSAPLQEPPSGR